jgi:hypothetical protein
MAFFNTLTNISPLQGLYLWIPGITTNICAALPLKKAAEQQNICSDVIAWFCQSCIAAKY